MIYLDHYFATARERYSIMLRRSAGEPRQSWTQDSCYRQWRFCNVHREDDRTTVWFRENIRDPLSSRKSMRDVVEATLIFRWFNRIETGEIIRDLLLGTWNSDTARQRLTGVSPVVTGAYIIKGDTGYSKLDGVLRCIDFARIELPRMLEVWQAQGQELTLQSVWSSLQILHQLGPFMAYEVVSDLRWTPLLQHAPDIRTWANAGPGCARGLSRVVTGKPSLFNRGSRKDQMQMVELMQEILEHSQNDSFWPQAWKPWEMREAEHWACEYDKYKRAEEGDNLKRRFTHHV